MLRHQVKEILPFATAFADGKEVQYKNFRDQWEDAENMHFSDDPSRYRIKPELHDFLWAVQQVSDETGYTCRDANPNEVLTKSRDGALRMNQVGMERPRPIYIDEALATDWRFHNNGE